MIFLIVLKTYLSKTENNTHNLNFTFKIWMTSYRRGLKSTMLGKKKVFKSTKSQITWYPFFPRTPLRLQHQSLLKLLYTRSSCCTFLYFSLKSEGQQSIDKTHHSSIKKQAKLFTYLHFPQETLVLFFLKFYCILCINTLWGWWWRNGYRVMIIFF